MTARNKAITDCGSVYDLKKVSMNLTLKDIENSLYLKEVLNERNQASVVSRSMSFTSQMAKLLSQTEGNKLVIVNEITGERREVILPGLFNF